jgi:hypothetical protein
MFRFFLSNWASLRDLAIVKSFEASGFSQQKKAAAAREDGHQDATALVYRSRTVLLRKSAYAFASPSRKGILAFQPMAASRELSRSFRGVPSGLEVSYSILPRNPTTSATA